MVGLDLSPMGKKTISRARESIISNLSLVTKSGKYCLGYEKSLRALINKNAKLVIYASNIQPVHRSVIEYYSMLSDCKLLQFEGDNVDLGTACGKFFRSSVIAVIDAGESDIINLIADKQ